MIQESESQLVPSPAHYADEPTEPRIPAQRLLKRSTEAVLQARCNGTFTVSIDEQGIVRLVVAHQDATVLKPEEAFELLDFLYEYRNLLAARSAEVAESQSEPY